MGGTKLEKWALAHLPEYFVIFLSGFGSGEPGGGV